MSNFEASLLEYFFPTGVTICAMSIYLQSTSEIFYYIEIHTMKMRHKHDDGVNVIGCFAIYVNIYETKYC